MALNKQVWESQIQEGFYSDDSFLKETADFSHSVNANTLHVPSAGADPDVLINNKTYPIKVVKRVDGDCEITLDTFSTENTLVRLPEAIEYNYDQLESVISQHRDTLKESCAEKAAHAIAPNEHTPKTPVFETTGETVGARKRMTFNDIITMKERFDMAKVPLKDRILVLHPSHVSDLLREDIELFKNLTDYTDGKPFRFAGFKVFSFPTMPQYKKNGLGGFEKIAFHSKEIGSFASIAYQKKEVMRADGSVKMYSKVDDPEERATIVGFDKRFVCMPIRNLGIGAIVSAEV